MVERERLVAAEQALAEHMEALYIRALTAVDAYYTFKDEMNKQMDWRRKSSLKPRVRKRELSVVAEWYEKRWYPSGKGGERKPYTTYIDKPRGKAAYSMSKILKYAQDWEREKVIETEKEFAKIRHEATCVMKALTYIRKAMEDDPTDGLVVNDEERPAKRRAAAA